MRTKIGVDFMTGLAHRGVENAGDLDGPSSTLLVTTTSLNVAYQRHTTTATCASLRPRFEVGDCRAAIILDAFYDPTLVNILAEGCQKLIKYTKKKKTDMAAANLSVIIQIVPIRCTFLFSTDDELGGRGLQCFLMWAVSFSNHVVGLQCVPSF
jgi:hypothetical protein